MKKSLALILFLAASLSLAAPANRYLLGNWMGAWSNTKAYKTYFISNTPYFAAGMVTESNGSLWILNGTITAPVGILPESSSAWDKLSNS